MNRSDTPEFAGQRAARRESVMDVGRNDWTGRPALVRLRAVATPRRAHRPAVVCSGTGGVSRAPMNSLARAFSAAPWRSSARAVNWPPRDSAALLASAAGTSNNNGRAYAPPWVEREIRSIGRHRSIDRDVGPSRLVRIDVAEAEHGLAELIACAPQPQDTDRRCPFTSTVRQASISVGMSSARMSGSRGIWRRTWAATARMAGAAASWRGLRAAAAAG